MPTSSVLNFHRELMIFTNTQPEECFRPAFNQQERKSGFTDTEAPSPFQ
jgi:hypothetical protein